MTITHNLIMDFQKKDQPQCLHAVQGDHLTREVSMELFSAGEAWEIPVCDVLVRYCKSDGTSGAYDLLGDTTLDYASCGNLLIMTLSPVLLDTAGVVQVQVELSAKGQRLGMFPFLIVVEPGLEDR